MNLDRVMRVARRIAPRWLEDDAAQEAALWCLLRGYEVRAGWVVVDLLRREPPSRVEGDGDLSRDRRREQIGARPDDGDPPPRLGYQPCPTCGITVYSKRRTYCTPVCRPSALATKREP